MKNKSALPKKKKSTPAEKKLTQPIERIVAIGASAGGLEAVSTLLKYLPPDTGLSFIYIQHLSPDHPSNLVTLLSRSTKMMVQEAKDNLRVERNHVYVCTPNHEMTLARGIIKLKPRARGVLPYLPIDDFFKSLVKTYKKDTLGIVLSGNATDGTEGLLAIKNAGGITFAQDISAKYDSMPKSAIDSNAATFVMSPKQIARQIVTLSKNGFKNPTVNSDTEISIPDDSVDLKKLFSLMYKSTGVDFSYYKLAALKRRLNYRMLHSGVDSLHTYTQLLSEKNDETSLLFKDLLINVTSFFRDPKAFRYLKSTFFPKLLKSKGQGEPLRIWVAACSTGEEVYSIAMILEELRTTLKGKIAVKIFASDLSEQAIHVARIGEYSKQNLKQVSKTRLKRFFTPSGEGYRVNKDLREMCVFAPHNILSDPPFSRIDFVSCCNLLIYFDAVAQKKALATMSFALNDGGYLMLGKSESIGSSSLLFTQVDSSAKIYSRKHTVGVRKIPLLMNRLPGTLLPKEGVKSLRRKPTRDEANDLDRVIDKLLLDKHMPACAIINKDLDILKFRGSTSLFLTHGSGNASLNILKMTRPEFAFELRNAIHKAFNTQQAITKTEIEIKIGSTLRIVSLEVSALKTAWEEPLLAVVFKLHDKKELRLNASSGKQDNSDQKVQKIKKLAQELVTTRAEMNSVIEIQERAFEELQAANEEIVSTNEEFQTLNEELETSKEEIEATNEELISTNHELQMRNDLLTESYKYSEAIIATIHEPLIILDSNFRVRSASKAYYTKFLTTKEETEGQLLFEIGNKQWDRVQLRRLLASTVSKNAEFSSLEIRRHFNGIGEKILLLNAHRIVQKTHGEQLILLAIEDITERTHLHLKEKETMQNDINLHKEDNVELEKAVKRRTRQLELKNIELIEANKDLTSFTFISSHDLQEPLRKIKNFVSVLIEEEKKKLSPDGRDYLQRTYETANRMQTLLEDLLLYSRTKNQQRRFESTDLNQVLREVELEHKEELSAKKAVIKSSKLHPLNVIRFQFRQLFHNLISNSLKFAKPNIPARISIKSSIVSGSKLNLQKRSVGTNKLFPKIDYCHIAYTDNGIGFDPYYNERIFNVFQRLHSQDEYQGTGMGLAICQRIVEIHKGVITAQGKINHGVKFDIYIPFVKPEGFGST